MTDLKYLHCVYKITDSMKQALNEVPRRGGMYNWMFLFKGTMAPFHSLTKKDIENYDVVQINMSPVDQLLVKEVRNMIGNNSNTLIIANNDYPPDAWDTLGQHPLEYMQVQENADAVFGTEQYQTSMMRDDAYIIPHPHWIDMLKHIGNDDKIDNHIGVIYHWWEGRSYHSSLILQKLRRKYPKILTKLYGFTTQYDRNKRWQKVMFDLHMPLMNYPDFIRSLQTNEFLYEPCHYHTYGRTTVDTAALRIPVVGTNRVFSMRYCYPNMCFDPMDAHSILNIMDKILTDKGWVEEQLDIAYERCEYFNYENSKKRYMTMVEETHERLGK